MVSPMERATNEGIGNCRVRMATAAIAKSRKPLNSKPNAAMAMSVQTIERIDLLWGQGKELGRHWVGIGFAKKTPD